MRGMRTPSRSSIVEVDDVVPNAVLATKLATGESGVFQSQPRGRFGRREISTQFFAAGF